MKHPFALAALAGLVLTAASPRAAAFSDPPVLPVPHQARYGTEALSLSGGIDLRFDSASARIGEIAGILRDGLADRGVRGAGPVRIELELDPAAAGGAGHPEAYTLRVGDDVEVRANDPRGLLWGVQTLLQSVESTSARPAFLRRGEIADEPDRAWRALMLDPARSFLDRDFLRRTIRVMSAYKLNVLNLHLIDDQAWRFETRAFPKCNRPGEPLYTQSELRALADYARRYGVDLVPEIDFPGHVTTAVAAYPQLDCEGKVRPLNQAILCAGKPFTWTFMDKVVAEVAAVFPSRYLEIGADEPFAIRRWETCPDCRRRMREKGVATTTAFYHTFVADLDALVKRHGKILLACNDAITPGVEPMPPRDILIQAWVDYDRVEPLAEAGYPIINATNHPLYISSLGLRAGNPLSTVYGWNATLFAPPGIAREAQTIAYRPLGGSAHILGGEVSAWATEQRLAERRLYPRVQAVADALWSENHRGDLAQFENRFRFGHLALLRRLGVPDDDALPVETPFRVLHRTGWRASPKSYGDFVLTCEQRSAGDRPASGLWIRCPAAPAGDASPNGYAVNIHPPAGIVTSDKFYRPGAWNQLELTARGPIVSLTINDGLAWSFIDRSPRPGSIVLSPPADGIEFRNLRVRPLPPPSAE